MMRYGSIFALALSTMVMPLVGSGTAAASPQHSKVTAGVAGNRPIAQVRFPVQTTGDPTPLPTLGRPQPQKSGSFDVTLNTLRRDSTGLVTLVWTARNPGSNDRLSLIDYFRDRLDARVSPYISGVTLVDEAAQLRYNSLQVIPSHVCTCTDTSAVPAPVTSGMSVTLYNTYKLPSNISTVTVDVPGWSPLKNVKIS